MLLKIHRLNEVKVLTGLSRSTIYLYVTKGLLTAPIKIGVRSVGWPENEISSLNAARIAGKSNAEIMRLVVELQNARVQREGV